MFYTPNKTDYVTNVNLLSGLKQEIMFGEIAFNYKKMKNNELFKETGTYYPLIVSINYNS